MKMYLPFHLPALGQEFGPKVCPPPKNDLIRREPLPIDPCNLIASLRRFRPSLSLVTLIFLWLFLPIPFIGDIIAALFLFVPFISDILAGVRVGVVVVPMEGRLYGRIELPDPGSASDNPQGGVDLVLGIAGGLVDEGGSKGGVSSEPECTATHRGVVGRVNKAGMALGVYM